MLAPLPQTPAERVKAKMKFMLDKSTAALTKQQEEGEEEEAVYVPSAAQLEEIEAEGFETTKFVSHRTAGKVSVWVPWGEVRYMGWYARFALNGDTL